jgi:MYXO-CTERM domain-containing protein
VTGLPPGVNASFNPSSINAGGTSTLTLVAPTGTAAAAVTLTVTGTAGAVTHTTTAQVSITVEVTKSGVASGGCSSAGGGSFGLFGALALALALRRQARR